MARVEQVSVKLIKGNDYDSIIKAMKDDAKALQTAFGSIKVGDARKALQDQAKASKEAAAAAIQNAKAKKAESEADEAAIRLKKREVELEQASIRVKREEEALNKARAASAKQIYDADASHIKLQREEIQLQNTLARQTEQTEKARNKLADTTKRLGESAGQVNKADWQNIEAMRQYIQSLQGFENAQVKATGAIHTATGTFQTYNAATQEAGNVTHNYRFSVEQATGKVYELDKGIKTTALSMRDWSSILRSLRTLIGFTGVVQSLRSAFSGMRDMSDELASYKKVTDATESDMQKLRDAAYDVAKAYGQSASDVVASAATMARAGYKENAIQMAELATKTMLVGDMTSEAANKFLIAVDAAYKYKGSIKDLSAVLDAANEIDNNYATTIDKLSEGMTLVASLASTAHVPIEELMAALGTMTAVTQRSGSETARGLRSIILNIMGDTSTEIEEGVKATKESVSLMTEVIQKYGDESVKASIKAGKMINPMQAIVSLQKAWKNNAIEEKDLFKVSESLGNKRYYNVFTALIQNPEMYNEMLQSIAESTGSASKEVETQMEAWSRKIDTLKTSWQELVNNSISEGFIKDLIDGATAAIQFAGSLENVAIMAGGAFEAIRALSAGISNLRQPGADMSLKSFGGFNLATSIIGTSIAAIGLIKSAYDANQRALLASAREAAANAVESVSKVQSVQDISDRYEQIAKDGIQSEKGELGELKTLQDELNGLVGDQATAIDLVNGKYEDTIKKLKNITQEQKEAVEIELRKNLTTALTDFSKADLNGDWMFGGNTSVPVPMNGKINDLINTFEYFYSEASDNRPTNTLKIRNKPQEAEKIIAFYEEIKALYDYMGTYTIEGTKAGIGEKTIGESLPSSYSQIGTLFNKIEEYAKPVKDIYEALQDLYKETEELGSSSGPVEEASDAIEDLAESVDGLTSSIQSATDAKEQFDKAMGTTKADAFKDYMDAFDTFKKELDEGRVNSTAMYAAARMMLGDSAYAAAGSSYSGVMAALNKSGSAGSVLDAYNLLNAKYQDENQNEVAGFGVYELIRRSGVFTEDQLRDEEGNYFIPDLSDAELTQISDAYGGILKEVIINALNALDQYDLNGEATDESLKIAKEEAKSAEEETTDQITDLGEAAQTATDQVEKLGDAMEEAAEKIEGSAEGTGEAIGGAATGVGIGVNTGIGEGAAGGAGTGSGASSGGSGALTWAQIKEAAEASQQAADAWGTSMDKISSTAENGITIPVDANTTEFDSKTGASREKAGEEVTSQLKAGVGDYKKDTISAKNSAGTPVESELTAKVNNYDTDVSTSKAAASEGVESELTAEVKGFNSDVAESKSAAGIGVEVPIWAGPRGFDDVEKEKASIGESITVEIIASTSQFSADVSKAKSEASSPFTSELGAVTSQFSSDVDSAKTKAQESVTSDLNANVEPYENRVASAFSEVEKAETEAIVTANTESFDESVAASKSDAGAEVLSDLKAGTEPYDSSVSTAKSNAATEVKANLGANVEPFEDKVASAFNDVEKAKPVEAGVSADTEQFDTNVSESKSTAAEGVAADFSADTEKFDTSVDEAKSTAEQEVTADLKANTEPFTSTVASEYQAVEEAPAWADLNADPANFDSTVAESKSTASGSVESELTAKIEGFKTDVETAKTQAGLPVNSEIQASTDKFTTDVSSAKSNAASGVTAKLDADLYPFQQKVYEEYQSVLDTPAWTYLDGDTNDFDRKVSDAKSDASEPVSSELTAELENFKSDVSSERAKAGEDIDIKITADTEELKTEVESIASAAESEEKKLRRIKSLALDISLTVTQIGLEITKVENWSSNKYLMELNKLLNSLTGKYTLDIYAGEETTTTAEMAKEITDLIKNIRDKKIEGEIPVSFADNANEQLVEQLASIIESVQTAEELKDVLIAIDGDPALLEEKVQEALEKKREALNINIDIGNEKEFNEKIAELTKEETKTINIKYTEEESPVEETLKQMEEEANQAGEEKEEEPRIEEASIEDAEIDDVKIEDAQIEEAKIEEKNEEKDNGWTAQQEEMFAEAAKAQNQVWEGPSAANLEPEAAEEETEGIYKGIDDIIERWEANGGELAHVAPSEEKVYTTGTEHETVYGLLLRILGLDKIDTQPQPTRTREEIMAEYEREQQRLAQFRKEHPEAESMSVLESTALYNKWHEQQQQASMVQEVIANFIDKYKETENDLETTLKDMGMTWEELRAVIVQYNADTPSFAIEGVTPETTKEELEEKIKEEYGISDGIPVGVTADPEKALKTVGETIKEIENKNAVLTITGKIVTSNVTKLASGTKRHKGGTAFVNDGEGPELLVDQGTAFIANNGKPAIVNLSPGAKVFTASETRQIFGGGVPAYATGIGSLHIKDGITAVTENKEEEGKTEEAGYEEQATAKFEDLATLVEYVINRMGEALEEQTGILDQQIQELKLQREATKQQDELAEKQRAVAEAMGQRTVRYIDENGQWHWMADQNKVKKAQQALAEYEDEMSYNAQVQALEDQKKALQNEYNEITKMWSKIQSAVNTPTGDLYQVLAELLANGTGAEKKGALTVQDTLIGQMMQGGSYSANYTESLHALELATKGEPLMPGESDTTLASLISMANSMGNGDDVANAMKATALEALVGGNTAGTTGAGLQTNFNYFINGVQLGSDQANMPLSDIMRTLTVYTNTGVS